MLNQFENLKKENEKMKKEIAKLKKDIVSFKCSFQVLSKDLDKVSLVVSILISQYYELKGEKEND